MGLCEPLSFPCVRRSRLTASNQPRRKRQIASELKFVAAAIPHKAMDQQITITGMKTRYRILTRR